MFVRLKSSYPAGSIPGGSASAAWTASNNGNKIMTADLTNTGELKLGLSNQDVIDNEEKTWGHAGHAFYNDVGRAAVLSFTIEGSLMRLWHHSRSHTAVSALFDIYVDLRWFVEFVLFNTYAPLSLLGIDPTVRRVVDVKAHLQYQFDLYSNDGSYKTYETVSTIEEASPKRMYSRAMRVFVVRRVRENSDDPLARVLEDALNVLRDYWVYCDVPDEGAIQKQIFRKLMPLSEWNQIKDHFMGIEEDGAVRYPPSEVAQYSPSDPVRSSHSSVPSPPADTKFYHFLQKNNPNDAAPAKAKVTSAASLRDSQQRDGIAQLAPQADPDPLLRVHGKKHCRTKYVQLCMDLYKVSSPALYFFALSQVVKILKYLKRAGYLHRDVSPGNFLLYHRSGKLPEKITAELDQWITLVSDLEYARPYHGGTGHDPLTGTANFVAVEVQKQAHEFEPPQSDFRNRLPISKFFAFNFYHDLESALWMALDFAFRKVPRSRLGSLTPLGPAEDLLRASAAGLFPASSRGSDHRTACFTKNGTIGALLEVLDAVHGADAPISRILDLIPQLREAYSRVEDSADVPLLQLDNERQVLDDTLFTEDIYDKMEGAFSDISNAYLGRDEEFVWVPDPPPKEIEHRRMASAPRSMGPTEPIPAVQPEETIPESSEDGSRPTTPTPAPRTRRHAKQAEDDERPVRDASSDSQRSSRKRAARDAGTESNAPRKRSRPSPQPGPVRRSKRLVNSSQPTTKPAKGQDASNGPKTRSGGRDASPKNSAGRSKRS
ncbi:hypothetical protein HDZ31DRAFT_28322 [Schizophyllum fasciatum]